MRFVAAANALLLALEQRAMLGKGPRGSQWRWEGGGGNVTWLLASKKIRISVPPNKGPNSVKNHVNLREGPGFQKGTWYWHHSFSLVRPWIENPTKPRPEFWPKNQWDKKNGILKLLICRNLLCSKRKLFSVSKSHSLKVSIRAEREFCFCPLNAKALNESWDSIEWEKKDCG